MAQRLALATKDAPDKVKSSQGEKSTAAWGKGKVFAFKLNMSDKARPPPAESPAITKGTPGRKANTA
jgi:hypothetical protein